jgi:hypothetical protein
VRFSPPNTDGEGGPGGRFRKICSTG